MTTRAQGMILAVIAAVLIRLSVTGEYLRFVAPWMRWPLFATGLVLGILALRPLLPSDDEPGNAVPRSTWLLLLPALVVLAVAPPPLGAYLAERRADQAVALRAPADLSVAAREGPLTLMISEFQWAANQPGDPMGITGREITLSGFVTRDADGWYVTQFEMFCCAADAMVTRARIEGHASPPRNQWLEVVGTWVKGTGADPAEPPVLTADDVAYVEPPENTYR